VLFISFNRGNNKFISLININVYIAVFIKIKSVKMDQSTFPSIIIPRKEFFKNIGKIPYEG